MANELWREGVADHERDGLLVHGAGENVVGGGMSGGEQPPSV